MSTSLVLYNSMTKTKEPFVPWRPPQVLMYVCGPTVYGYLHVGNFRGAIVYNLLRNWLEHSGFKVKFVYNYTDVDDKIIERAQQESLAPELVAKKYIEEFEKDFLRLRLRKHDLNPKVSESIPEIIEMVQTLVRENKAYEAGGDVWYSVRAFPEYGKLSRRDLNELRAGTRVDAKDGKRDPEDFALWKSAKPGEPAWESPWGRGRPGWHIECSAMIHKHLGEQIDIHGGGLDLVFPHHENEIAQSEGCSHKTFVKYWVHNNMINVAGTKMSKSLGNIVTGREFIERHHPEVLKFLVLSSHYRSVADFADETIHLAVKGLARFYSALALAEEVLQSPDFTFDPLADEKLTLYFNASWVKLSEALNDDLNTPSALATLFDVLRDFNRNVRRGGRVDARVSAWARSFKTHILKFGHLASLFEEEPKRFLHELDGVLMQQMGIDRSQVESLIAQRIQARSAKNFLEADRLRKELESIGIAVSDTTGGTHWEVQK